MFIKTGRAFIQLHLNLQLQQNTLTAGTLKTDGTQAFVAVDRITFKVTQIGSSEPGEGVRFTMKGKV